MTNKKIKRFSQTRFIVLGFIIIILIGTLLLMTPLASKDNSMTSFMDCIFTAVSTTCVTGLAAVDTYSHWSFFGQVIILCLIQIGGLGFITIGVFFSVLLRRRIGLKTRGMMQESVNTLQIGGVVKLTKKIIKGTFISFNKSTASSTVLHNLYSGYLIPCSRQNSRIRNLSV